MAIKKKNWDEEENDMPNIVSILERIYVLYRIRKIGP